MDVGPLRKPRPVDRAAMSRPLQTQRQAEAPQPAKEAPRTVYRAATPGHTTKQKKPSKRFMLPIVMIVIVVIVGVAGWFVWSKMQGSSTTIDSSKYQAVFLSNGQVYFGKLHSFNSEYMKLDEIFYLEASSTEEKDPANPQKTTTDPNNVRLIKLGDEVHGPQDQMTISKSQILFFENLKSEGKVAQSIEKFKNGTN